METQGTGSGRSVERRRFLQQTATVAFAAPVIASMMSGAARAQTGLQCGTTIASGSPDCNVTNPCATGFECLGPPLAAGSPCGCVPTEPPINP